MKKKAVITMMMAFSMMLAGCAGSKSKPAVEDTVEIQNEETAPAEEEMAKEEDSEPDPENVQSDQNIEERNEEEKQELSVSANGESDEETNEGIIADAEKAYQSVLSDYVTEFGGEDPRYLYAYIDEDDIPEMIIIDNESHVASPVVYTYYEGQAVRVGSYGSLGEMQYVEKQNYIISFYSGMGATLYDAYRIVDGKEEQLMNLYWSDVEGYPSERCVNGVDVSDEELQKTYEEYFGSKQTKTARYADGISINP